MTHLNKREQGIEAREKMATKGDWEITATGGNALTPGTSDILIGTSGYWIARLFHPESHVRGTTSLAPSSEEAFANAIFIAQAHQDIPYLLETIEMLRKERRK